MILAIQTGLSNARSEGYNRIIKHVGRIAFEFKTPENRRRRVRCCRPCISTFYASIGSTAERGTDA
jgi:Transposase